MYLHLCLTEFLLIATRDRVDTLEVAWKNSFFADHRLKRIFQAQREQDSPKGDLDLQNFGREKERERERDRERERVARRVYVPTKRRILANLPIISLIFLGAAGLLLSVSHLETFGFCR